jgi:regulator of replication initiation timing
MAEEKDGYILDVIANLQKDVASVKSSNEYLRNSVSKLMDENVFIKKENDKQAKLILEQEEKLKEIPKLKEMNKELLENITILRQALQNKIEAQDALATKCNDEFPLS